MHFFIFFISFALFASIPLPDEFTIREQRIKQLSSQFKEQLCQDGFIIGVILEIESGLNEIRKIYRRDNQLSQISEVKISELYKRIDDKILFLQQKYDECLKNNISQSTSYTPGISMSYSQRSHKHPQPEEKIEYVQPPETTSSSIHVVDINNQR